MRRVRQRIFTAQWGVLKATAAKQEMVNLGKALRRARLSAHLTQEQLAELADLNPRTVQKIEAGEIDILVTTLRRLQRATNSAWDALLG